MPRLVALLLVLSLSCSVVVSGQHAPGQNPIRDSIEREATHLAVTWSVPNRGQPPRVQTYDTLDRSDWGAIPHLSGDARVAVLTSQQQTIKGRITSVSDDALEVDRQGRLQRIRRDEVREVRLEHRLGVAQSVGLGLLLGGLTGYLAGSAAACDPHVCGGEGGLVIAGSTLQGIVFGGISGFGLGQAVHARPGRLVYAPRASH